MPTTEETRKSNNPIVYQKPCKGTCGMPLMWQQLPNTEYKDDRWGDYCEECDPKNTKA
jgi:hypothetical protein